jgi:hypothetical protein
MQSLQGVNPLVVPPLLQLEGHRPLQAVYLSFKSRVPCEFPLPPKLVLSAYLILNTSRLSEAAGLHAVDCWEWTPRGPH